MNRAMLAVLSVLLLAGFPRGTLGSTADEREAIVEYLLHHSNRLVRPDGAGGGGTPVEVDMSLSDIRILDVDNDRRLVKIAGYLVMTWTDPRMSFRDFRGMPTVPSVRLDSASVWVPDIELFNTDTPGLKSMDGHYLVVVRPTGDMIYVPQVTYNSYCEPMNVGQREGLNCTMSFGSWAYPGHEVDLQVTENPDLKWTSFIRHWTVASSSVKRQVKQYDCCPDEDYITAVYSLQLVHE